MVLGTIGASNASNCLPHTLTLIRLQSFDSGTSIFFHAFESQLKNSLFSYLLIFFSISISFECNTAATGTGAVAAKTCALTQSLSKQKWDWSCVMCGSENSSMLSHWIEWVWKKMKIKCFLHLQMNAYKWFLEFGHSSIVLIFCHLVVLERKTEIKTQITTKLIPTTEHRWFAYNNNFQPKYFYFAVGFVYTVFWHMTHVSTIFSLAVTGSRFSGGQIYSIWQIKFVCVPSANR